MLTRLWALLLLLGVARTLWLEPARLPALPFQEVGLSLSEDGRWLAFEAQRGAVARGRIFGRREEDGWTDIYLADLDQGGSLRISAGANGPSHRPCLSPDGRWLAFTSEASNLVGDDRDSCQDVFLYEIASRRLERVPPPRELAGRCPSDWAAFGTDLLAFASYAPDRRLWLYDPRSRRLAELWGGPVTPFGPASFAGDRVAFSGLFKGTAEIWGGRLEGTALTGRQRLSCRPDGGSPNGPSLEPCLSAARCAFVSCASDLVEGDDNHGWDVFVRDLEKGRTERIGDGLEPCLSKSGRYLAYTSQDQVLLADLEEHTSQSLGSGYAPAISGDGGRVAFLNRSGQLRLWERGRPPRQVQP